MGASCFNSMEIDAIGEIMNISLGASATAVSTMLGAKVDITTPVVNVLTKDEFEFKNLEPAVGVEISYTEGLEGKNVMMFRRNDVRIIVGMLMGGEIPEEAFELDEITISAICEVMNQMMGSSATALSEFLGIVVNISTPQSFEERDEGAFKDKYFDDGATMVVVRFLLEIEGKLKSEFLNIMSIELTKRLLQPFEGALSAAAAEEKKEEPAPEAAVAPEQPAAQPSVPEAVPQPAAAQSPASEVAPQPAMADQPPVPEAVPQPAAAGQPVAGQPSASEAAPQPTIAGQPPVPEAAFQPTMAGQPVSPAGQPAVPPVMPAGQPPYPAYQQAVQPGIYQPDPMLAQMMTQMQQTQAQIMTQMQQTQAQMMEMMQGMRTGEKNQQQVSRKESSLIRPLSPGSLEDTYSSGEEEKANQEMLMQVPLEVSVEIGRTKKLVKDILEFTQGSLVVLDKMAGEQVDLFVNGQCIARGDIVVVEDNFGIRITEIVEKNLNPESL